MKKSFIGIGIIGVLLVLIVGIFISKYNQLVSLNESVESNLSNVDVQLERRADLIPNLVNTVKGYMKHEETVINSITSSREKMVNASSVDAKNQANNELTTALNNLYVVVENYPNLKADTNFIQLQDELAGTENRIAVARRDYNESVVNYNKNIKSFPSNLIAKMFEFEEKQYFEASEESKEVPDVSFED